jgi:predicted transcriptional regulator
MKRQPKTSTLADLSRRERQVLEVIYREGKCSAAEIRNSIEQSPSYSAIRAVLRVLEEKGLIRHRAEELHYVYLPAVSHDRAVRSAVRHVLDSLFGGSVERIMAALLDVSAERLSREELERVSQMIEQAKRRDMEPEK